MIGRCYGVAEGVRGREDSIGGNRKVWHYYIRRYSSTVIAKGADEQDLISLANKVPFDDRFNQGFRIDDLRHPLMQSFLEEVNSALAEGAPSLSVEALGRQMNVAGGPNESPWPKNVGLMFFNETPDVVLPVHRSMCCGFRKALAETASTKSLSRAH